MSNRWRSRRPEELVRGTARRVFLERLVTLLAKGAGLGRREAAAVAIICSHR